MKTKPYLLKCGSWANRGLLFSFLLTVIALVFVPVPVKGVNVQTSYFRLNGGTADFGSGNHSFGSPDDFAVVKFDYTTIGGQLVATGRVQGTLYWDDAFSSGCARVTIRFRDSNDNNLALRNIDRCGPGGNANFSSNKINVDESFSSSNLVKIRISTAQVNGTTLSGGASTTVNAPLSKTIATRISAGGAEFEGAHLCSALALCPRGDAEIGFFRNNGLVSSTVSGTLYTANFFNFFQFVDCARIRIEFRTINAAVLSSRTRDTCDYSRTIGESFDNSGTLFQTRLQVGELVNGDFHNSVARTFDFSGQTGNFEIEPIDGSTAVNSPLNLAFTWTVPEPLNWHDLQRLDLRLRDEFGMVLFWVRFDEASNAFSVFNERSGRFGPAFAPGSPNKLQTQYASLHLAEASVNPVNSVPGSGPNSPGVTLNLPLSFKPSAGARTYTVEVAASDDLGNEDPFAVAGTLTVAR